MERLTSDTGANGTPPAPSPKRGIKRRPAIDGTVTLEGVARTGAVLFHITVSTDACFDELIAALWDYLDLVDPYPLLQIVR